MKIEKLVLSGYHRLAIRGIRYFEYTPDNIHQIILGTNGSGKTSVLRELTPMPAISSNYENLVKNGNAGFKTITVSHKDKTYVLSSVFSTPTGKHSIFDLDQPDVNLNPGGTLQVQRKVVCELFGITQNLIDVAIGTQRFTTMDKTNRSEWIMALSGNDLGFAMKVFNDLKTKVRDTKGALKFINKKLTDESNRLVSEEELVRLGGKCDLLKKDLSILMDVRDNTLPKTTVVRAALEECMATITNTSQSVLSLRTVKPAPFISITQQSELDELIVKTTTQLNDVNVQLEQNTDELDKALEMLKAIDSSNCQDVSQLTKINQELLQRIEVLSANLETYDDLTDPHSAVGSVNAIYQTIIDILMSLPDNSSGEYGSEARESHLKTMSVVKHNRELAIRDKHLLQQKIKSFEEADNIDCPKCGHGFKHSPMHHDDYLGCKRAFENVCGVIDGFDKQLVEQDKHLAGLNEYAQNRNYLINIFRDNLRFKSLWVILNNALKESPPQAILPTLANWREANHTAQTILNLKLTYDKNQTALSHALELAKKDESNQGGYVNVLQQRQSKLTELQVRLQITLGYAKRFKSEVSKITAHMNNLDTVTDRLDTVLRTYSKCLYRDLIQSQIMELQTDLAHCDLAYTNAKSIRDVIADLEISKLQLQNQLEVQTILMNELSPVDGLIADQLKGFIECFVQQMNNIIAQIWSYDMVVLPCENSDGELDYKFPVSIEGNAPISSDVCEVSGSQTDIIDFAFKLTVMLYMELSDFPIYLDELAPTLDEQHRINIMNYVKRLVETKQCSQMFMISHYHDAHGIFTNAEVVVMNPLNIVNMPSVYNNNVIIR